MAHTCWIDRHARLARITVSGTENFAKIRARAEEIFGDPDWSPGFNVLIDLRDVESVDMAGSDVQRVVELHQLLDSQIGHGRIAVVATQAVVFGMARMREIRSEGRHSAEFRVFREISGAEEWLGPSESQD